MEEILIEEYNYPLPDERIAKYPLAERDQSKLLIYRNRQVSEDHFHHIGEYLPADSLLIYNNTRVIQARLEFHKQSPSNAEPLLNNSKQPLHNTQGARIEIFCLEPLEPHDYQLSLGSTNGCTWKCMIGNAKKWKTGALSLPVLLPSGDTITLFAEKGEQTGNTFAVRFWWNTPASLSSPLTSHLSPLTSHLSFAEILDAVGELPIPPYLNRKTEESDKTTYQTVYSKVEGSVAAPTAGLHFTPSVLQSLNERGIPTCELTLHVGAGTFKPVKSDTIAEHEMHTEYISVSRQLIEQLCHSSRRVVAVGTTSVRTLESLYYIALTLYRNPQATAEELRVKQWAPYGDNPDLSRAEAMQLLLDYLDRIGSDRLVSATRIIIAPGYKFHIVDGIVTNFHQPRSTLLLLVSAFVQGDWRTIYDYALAHDFRFLSYGDSSLLWRVDE